MTQIFEKRGRRYVAIDGQIAVSHYDAWPLLLQSVRYSLGRMTAAPGNAQDAVRRYSEALTPHQLAQIGREVSEELQRHDDARQAEFVRTGEPVRESDSRFWVGWKCDDDGWRVFAAWCEAEATRRGVK